MNGLRDQLLACPRLAPEQHRGRRRRCLLHHLVHLPDARTVADNLSEAAMLPKLPSQYPHFPQCLLPFDDLLQQDLQPGRIDRLGQIVVRTLLYGFDRALDASLRRQDDKAHVPQSLAPVLQRTEQVESAHPGHHEVGDHDPRSECGELLQRLFAIRRGLGSKPPRADQLGQPDRVARSSSTMRTRASGAAPSSRPVAASAMSVSCISVLGV